MMTETPTIKETFERVADDNMKTFLAVQVAETRLASGVFGDKGLGSLFRVETQKDTVENRASKVCGALDEIVEILDPLTTQSEYDTKVRQVMCRIYRIELGNILPGIFNGFMNPIVKVTEGGQHELFTLPSQLNTIADCDFVVAVREWYESGGDLTRLESSPNWRIVGKVLNLKNNLEATDFDMGAKGIRYGINLNSNILWSREFGLTTSGETLPLNSKALHNKIKRVTWEQFCDDWLRKESFENEIGVMFRAALKMCTKPFTAINVFTRRDAFKYDKRGHLKVDFTMPDDLCISPSTQDGVDRITEIAIDNSELRATLNEINLHRLMDECMGCECNGIIEAFEHTTLKKSAGGRSYIQFDRVGGIGVGKDSGKAMGMAVHIITGKGLHSKDNSGVLSSTFRGKIGSEGYIITSLVCRTPLPPGPFGGKLFYRNHLITEGIQLLKLVEEYEYHVLGLETEAAEIPDHLKLGKEVKTYIIKGGFLLRGFNNIAGRMVIDSSVEKAACYLRLKEAYQKSGRLEICDCPNACAARQRILQYVGLTVDFVITLQEAGYTHTIQQICGTKIYEKFFSKYCTTEMINNILVFKFKKSMLPFQASSGKPSYEIFARESIPVKMAKRSTTMI